MCEQCRVPCCSRYDSVGGSSLMAPPMMALLVPQLMAFLVLPPSSGKTRRSTHSSGTAVVTPVMQEFNRATAPCRRSSVWPTKAGRLKKGCRFGTRLQITKRCCRAMPARQCQAVQQIGTRGWTCCQIVLITVSVPEVMLKRHLSCLRASREFRHRPSNILSTRIAPRRSRRASPGGRHLAKQKRKCWPSRSMRRRLSCGPTRLPHGKSVLRHQQLLPAGCHRQHSYLHHKRSQPPL